MKNRVKLYRRKRYLSQRELSDRTGISRVSISKIERFKQVPGLIIAMKLARELRIPVGQLFFLG